MRVGITGATGFIGRRIARRHLERGHAVRAFGRRPVGIEGVEMYFGDLMKVSNELSAFADGVDVLYHCAGEIRDESLMYALHVAGTRNLIAAADGRIGRWVQLSSAGAYGPSRANVFQEYDPPAPSGRYECTKTESDDLVQAASGNKAFSSVIVRPSIVFGPDMPNRSVFQMVSMIDSGWFFFIGKSDAIANYVYIEDVVDAVELCGTALNAHGIYLLSDDLPFEEFIAAIATELGRKRPRLRVPELPVRLLARLLGDLPAFPLTIPRLDALTRRVSYPSKRIRDHLGYSFRVGVRHGIAKFVQAWKSEH